MSLILATLAFATGIYMIVVGYRISDYAGGVVCAVGIVLAAVSFYVAFLTIALK